MKIRKLTPNLSMALALALLCAASAHAAPLSLQNASITATYNGAAAGMLGLDGGFTPGSNTSKLDPLNGAVEFLTADFLLGIDFDANGLLTVYNNIENAVSPGNYRMRFDFGASLANPITTFTFAGASGASGEPTLSIVDAHTVALDFNAVGWSGFGSLSAQLGTVPEPGAMALVLAGVAGLAFARRKRRR